ncbi:MAG: adenylate/guanylate cyclase domain-containing protein [Hyphomicrobiales bacterium]
MATPPSDRRLAAIVVADIVGYSRMVESDEAATLAAVKALQTGILEPLATAHNGRIVKLLGDGIIVEFSSVVQAVAFAVAVQKKTVASQKDIPAHRLVTLRIGINLGDVVVDGSDLLGDGVNIAARLEQLCEPGGVMVSGTVYDQMQGKTNFHLDFVGQRQVKNISRPIRAYRVRMDETQAPAASTWKPSRRLLLPVTAFLALLIVAGLCALWLFSGKAADARPSIAVLPFDNLGKDEATGRLADGITEDIITDLSRFRDLAVIARNSVEAYRGSGVDIRKVGRDLNVRYVLEGSIQHQGDDVRVTAQLIETDTGTHVWSERWDRLMADIFAVQTELSQQVAGQLGGIVGTVLTADRDAALRKRPNELTAYDLYLRAIEAKNTETPASIEECKTLLQQSLAIDPAFARAWTLLGACYAISQRWADDFDAVHAKYLEYVRRAVELDPMDAEAHAALAFALGNDGDLSHAQPEFETALRLNPNSADVLTRYAVWASAFGKAQEGGEMAERAYRLNPDPPSPSIRFLRGALLAAGRYDRAQSVHEHMPKAKYIDGDYVDGAIIMVALGQADEARKLVQEAEAAFPDLTIESWTGTVDWGDSDRKLYVKLMREAGFPACATPDQVKKFRITVRLPECPA